MTHNQEHGRQHERLQFNPQNSRSFEKALDQQGFSAQKVSSPAGRQELANQMHVQSVDLVHRVRPEYLPQSVAREQAKEMIDDILHRTSQLRARGRIQMGVTAAATGLNVVLPGIGLAGSVGSHVLGWNEAQTKKQLIRSIDALCAVAAASGLQANQLKDATDNLGNPLSKKHLGLRVRSILTSVFFPIARGAHRLVNDGKWADVEHEVKKLQRLLHLDEGSPQSAQRAAA